MRVFPDGVFRTAPRFPRAKSYCAFMDWPRTAAALAVSPDERISSAAGRCATYHDDEHASKCVHATEGRSVLRPTRRCPNRGSGACTYVHISQRYQGDLRCGRRRYHRQTAASTECRSWPQALGFGLWASGLADAAEGALRCHHRRQPEAVRAGTPEAKADAVGECVVQIQGDGGHAVGAATPTIEETQAVRIP